MAGIQYQFLLRFQSDYPEVELLGALDISKN